MTTTTQRLPVEALGDRELVDRLSKLPKDKQPFWLLNWQALEAMRENPQTYPQRPSHFNQPLSPSFSESASTSNGSPPFTNVAGFSASNQFSSSATAGSGATLNNNPMNVIPNPSTDEFENRFGNDDTNIDKTSVTAVQVLKPTYPIYAHVDDVLGNKYIPSQTSQSGSSTNNSGAKHTTSSNKPTNRKPAKENRKLALQDSTKFSDTDFFYAPPRTMFKQPILHTSFDDYMEKPFDLKSENYDILY